MKKLYFFSLFALLSLFAVPNVAVAQEFPGLDKSPHDIALYPRRGADKAIKVLYGRPQKNGREIFGALEAFGKVWRAGANETTEITLYKDVKVGGKALKAGTYALFAIPNQSSWTIVFNSGLNQWGAYTYQESADVLRIDVPTQKTPKTIEAFSITIEKSDTGADMFMAWDDTMVKVPFAF